VFFKRNLRNQSKLILLQYDQAAADIRAGMIGKEIVRQTAWVWFAFPKVQT
jgi:hypothetical protein